MKLPFPQASFLAPVLTAWNHVLEQADWATKKLQPFAGRRVRVAMPPLTFAFAIEANGLLAASEGTPDLVVELPAATPLLALQGNEQVMKAARIEGPADLADALSFVMRHLRWDAEEDLSKVVGDIAARRAMQFVSTFAGWQRQAARNLAENVGEYLVHENPTLVSAADNVALTKDLAELRNRLDRLETRIQLFQGNRP